MPPVMLVGVAFFLVGAALFMAMLFANGGAPRGRQLPVLGKLLSGALGAGKRTLTLVSLALIGFGACTSFAGVASKDRERARLCRERCVAEGYAEGRIGPSVERDPELRFVACTCSGGRDEPLELRADSQR